ncbi:TetR/AcrR family transcriptional regulator [Xanthomonas euvesicatoria]|uniref:TetR/AcrR family transcriptional regulator n=1 Tax=Xanthomonas euvesicatoria TaxID=456327 RepID=UPI0030C83B55
MTTETPDFELLGQRGPGEHAARQQIIDAARKSFSHFGYKKTSVTDIAKTAGLSKAYVYRFFESKEAIGQGLCAEVLGDFLAQSKRAATGGQTATDKLRLMFDELMRVNVKLCVEEPRLCEIALDSMRERWPLNTAYVESLRQLVGEIVEEGRQRGEFERKTPLNEVARAVMNAMEVFYNPLILQFVLHELPGAQVETMNLVLRSLSR